MTTITVDIGKALALPVDTIELAKHANVMEHVLYIGLRNILMDSHASVKREDFKEEIDWRNESKHKAELKLAALLRGEVRANSGTRQGKSVDPVRAEAIRLAKVKVLPHAKNTAQLDKWAESFGLANATEDDVKAILAEAIRRYAAKPETIATAEANVAKVMELDGDLDL